MANRQSLTYSILFLLSDGQQHGRKFLSPIRNERAFQRLPFSQPISRATGKCLSAFPMLIRASSSMGRSVILSIQTRGPFSGRSTTVSCHMPSPTQDSPSFMKSAKNLDAMVTAHLSSLLRAKAMIWSRNLPLVCSGI